tara:strand:- start:496 stop:741 length:246 start_codon:yes stop_codon:yes gene_type:complete
MLLDAAAPYTINDIQEMPKNINVSQTDTLSYNPPLSNFAAIGGKNKIVKKNTKDIMRVLGLLSKNHFNGKQNNIRDIIKKL